MAHDVFVSYSQADKAVADAVVARLEQDGIRCWMAPRDITPGTSWGEAIVASIADSQIMVLVLSAHSNRSRQVIREVQRAVADDVIILPFRIENIDPTGAMAYFLGTEHWLDALTTPVDRHIDRLRRTVGTLLAGDPIDSGDLDTPPSAVARRRRQRWLPYAKGAGAAAVAVAITLAVTLGGGTGGDSTTTTATIPTTTTTATTTTTTVPVSLIEVGAYQPMDLDPTDMFPPDAVYGLAVVDSWLVYANGIDGVTRASVADPAQPLPTETFAAYDAREVAFDGEWIYALLGEHAGELLIFNVNGSGGVTMEPTDNSPSQLVLADGFLYVSTHNYVGIIDVNDPLSPEVVHEWVPPGLTGNPATVFVAEAVGYFGAGWDGLYLFDLTDPSQPVALSHWQSPNWVLRFTVVDDTAYVAMGTSGLAIVDVSDPLHPAISGIAEIPGIAVRVVVAHGHAFVGWHGESGTLGGIAVVDATDPENPFFIETYGRFQTISGLELVNDHIIVADESSGLTVFGIEGIAE